MLNTQLTALLLQAAVQLYCHHLYGVAFEFQPVDAGPGPDPESAGTILLYAMHKVRSQTAGI
jgi:hypothetical protein